MVKSPPPKKKKTKKELMVLKRGKQRKFIKRELTNLKLSQQAYPDLLSIQHYPLG